MKGMNMGIGLPVATAIPRVALVTGGAIRLGRAIVMELARAGFSVAIHYRDSDEAARSALAELKAEGGHGYILKADLAREDETGSLVERVMAELGPVGVLVNNASVFERDEWSDATREGWDRHFEPNLRAPFVLTQAFARSLPSECEGMVLNMIDERVWSLTPHFMTYTLTKSALWTMTQTMALALAPKKIRVNAIGPGPALPSLRQTEEQFAKQCASVPLERGTSPDEVARAVIALLALPSVTGQMLALDGGQHLQWSPDRAGGVAPVE